jgi:hypothetical protein
MTAFVASIMQRGTKVSALVLIQLEAVLKDNIKGLGW